MADVASLKLMGFLLGSVTAAVMLMAVTLVTSSVASSSQGLDRLPYGYSTSASGE